MVQRRQAITDSSEVNVFIDLEACRRLGRSPEAILARRRCAECRARLGEAEQLPSAESQIAEIARCCSKKADFITTEMPLLEIAFRLLLVERNRPVGLRQLYYQVTEEWATPINPKSLSMEALQRILLKDRHYGFAMARQSATVP